MSDLVGPMSGAHKWAWDELHRMRATAKRRGKLLKEIYDWTKCKDTPWARKVAAELKEEDDGNKD